MRSPAGWPGPEKTNAPARSIYWPAGPRTRKHHAQIRARRKSYSRSGYLSPRRPGVPSVRYDPGRHEARAARAFTSASSRSAAPCQCVSARRPKGRNKALLFGALVLGFLRNPVGFCEIYRAFTRATKACVYRKRLNKFRRTLSGPSKKLDMGSGRFAVFLVGSAQTIYSPQTDHRRSSVVDGPNISRALPCLQHFRDQAGGSAPCPG